MKGQIQHPKYPAAELVRRNPVLPDGAVVYEADTPIFKVGDGVTHYNDLPPRGGGEFDA